LLTEAYLSAIKLNCDYSPVFAVLHSLLGFPRQPWCVGVEQEMEDLFLVDGWRSKG